MKIIVHGVATENFVLVGRAVRYLEQRWQMKDAILVYGEGLKAVTLCVCRNKDSITVRQSEPSNAQV